MGLAISDEHLELSRSVRRWLESNYAPEIARQVLESDPSELPGICKQIADQGWLGLHLAEADGGQGFTLFESAVVFEELGRALVAGPLLSSVALSATLAAQADGSELRALLPAMAEGQCFGAIACGPDRLIATGSVASGHLGAVLGLPQSSVVLVPVQADGSTHLYLLDVDAPGLSVRALAPLDPSRVTGVLEAVDVALPAGRRLLATSFEEVVDLMTALAAIESAGGARWCLETASDYAKVRVQFGRPIGQFQAIKHKLADMVVVSEQADAVAFDVAGATRLASADPERRLSTAVAAAIAIDGFFHSAKECVQILGGIGFTWEHDAHRYLKRSLANSGLFGTADDHNVEVAAMALAGVRRNLATDLPEEAEQYRAAAVALVAGAAALEGDLQRAYLVDEGLISPHWPRPWGREASALEQLVLDEEMAAAKVARPHIGIGAWALPTLIEHGTADQQERYVRPTLMGQLAWCQLFSEPGAGSDLAALSTRATKVDGGWILNGQKVWTSLAKQANFAICLARTDTEAAKHAGISYFVVDMTTVGIDIRPLRELTGMAMFNEVFLNDVFVPDDDLVGKPGQGWAIARTTLANERVSMSSGSAFGIGVVQVLRQLESMGDRAPEAARLRVGTLLSEAQSLALMTQRATLKSLSGTDPGAASSVRKLLGAEHEQRVQELGLLLCGPTAATTEDLPGRWSNGFLSTRCLTIAGGTSEVQRNVIAERILGQPKDPEPGS